MLRYGHLPLIGLAIMLLGAAIFTTVADRTVGLKLIEDADAARRQGNFSEAEARANEAVKYIGKQYGDPSVKLAEAYDCRGLVYEDEHRYHDAEADYLRSKLMLQQLCGLESPEMEHSLHRLGAFYGERDNYLEAESSLLRALGLAEKFQNAPAKGSFAPLSDLVTNIRGPADPETAAVLSDLGWLYSKQGQYDKAKTAYVRARDLRIQVLGRDHPLVKKSESDLRLVESLSR